MNLGFAEKIEVARIPPGDPVPGESYIQQTPTNQDVATASNAMKISVSHDVIATQYIAQTNYKTTKYSTG